MNITPDSKDDWKLIRDEEGIQIYLNEFWADKIKSNHLTLYIKYTRLNGVIQVRSSMDSLLAVITDIISCSRWVHYCSRQSLLLSKVIY